ncbi:BRO-N domain-containing protein [Brevundimonas sp. NPDC003935]|uniref:BRO-N domain-containing protein n=1 Tax=unclassified Brevundimonas TaxID=2622653 RepID=UPI00289640BF|nr:Bro-N domain-containing protein [Brevundimonas sp.]
MTDTAVFSFTRAADDVVNIRTVILDGEPWFFGTDVLQALNIAKGSTTDTYARISEDRKRYAGRTSLGLPGGRPVVLLNEAGLYDCVIRSESPKPDCSKAG